LVEQIANLMKRSYLNWNRDSVSDDVILNQLEELSKGQLKLSENSLLRSTQTFVQRNNNNNNNQHRGDRDKKRNNGGGKQHNNPHRHKNNNQNFKRKPF
jgi:hypothetical protein